MCNANDTCEWTFSAGEQEGTCETSLHTIRSVITELENVATHVVGILQRYVVQDQDRYHQEVLAIDQLLQSMAEEATAQEWVHEKVRKALREQKTSHTTWSELLTRDAKDIVSEIAEVKCPICLHTCPRVAQTTCCGNFVGIECVKQYASTKVTTQTLECPMCTQELNFVNLSLLQEVRNERLEAPAGNWNIEQELAQNDRQLREDVRLLLQRGEADAAARAEANEREDRVIRKDIVKIILGHIVLLVAYNVEGVLSKDTELKVYHELPISQLLKFLLLLYIYMKVAKTILRAARDLYEVVATVARHVVIEEDDDNDI
jgi:hypothetical protein